MLFNSLQYLIFFPAVFALYWLAPDRYRRPLLLAASYFFYMSWLPVYGLLLLSLTVVNYALGLAIDRWRQSGRIILIIGLAANLGTLCFYKYTNFLMDSIQDFLRAIAPFWSWPLRTIHPPDFDVLLPLGISFFAFEFIHYLTDVYRGDRPIRKAVDFALFAAFFPSQIAGPIKRFQDFVAQLRKPIIFDSALAHGGMALIVQGLFKKVALSDNLAVIVSAGFKNGSSLGTADAWVATLAFALQIYFDFSGYTDMGRGSAMMLGFSLPDNFKLPYIAANLSDFWRRWHISLSTWLRDYLYIPLGGGRVSRWRKHFNLLATMLLGGLWHGAAWHYVAWGGFHGLGLVASHEYDSVARRTSWLSALHATALGKLVSALLTFLTVLIGWVLFRADSVAQALQIIAHMFAASPSSAVVTLLQQSTLPVGLSVYALYALTFTEHPWRPAWLADGARRLAAVGPLRTAVYLGAFVAAIGFCPSHLEPFIYFQF